MIQLTTKPAVDKVLRGLSIDDRIGALCGSWQERHDIVDTLIRLLGFFSYIAARLTVIDRRNLANALREIAMHIEAKPAVELISSLAAETI